MLRLIIAALLSLSLAPALSAQITELRDYHGETIACTRSGLHGFAEPCSAGTGFYVYVFTGTVLSVADASNAEQRLHIAPEEIFYGQPPATLTVFTSQGRCLPEIRIGDKWLFYVRQSHLNKLTIYYGDSNGPVAETADNVALLRRLNQMHDGGLIRGHVSRSEWDEQDKAVKYSQLPGHEVTAKRASDNTEYAATTDPEGNYEFKPLPPGTYELSANTGGSLWAEPGEVKVKPGSCSYIGFELKAASNISGRVLYSRDQLSAPPQLEAVLESDQDVVPASVIASEDGSYELKGLNPGRYLVAASVPDPGDPKKEIRIYYPGVTSAGRAVLIELGKTETRAHIDFEIPQQSQR